MTRLVLLLVCVQFGCESVVDITVPDGYKSKIVVEGEFTPDSVWAIRISKSIPLNEADYGVLSDAVVVVSREGNDGDTLPHVGQGLYRTMQNLRPVAGERYSLQVSAPGHVAVEASSWAPPLESELVAVSRHAPQDTTGMERVSIRLRLKDSSGKNYYKVDLYQVVPVCTCNSFCNCKYNSWHQNCIIDKSGYTTRYWGSRFESTVSFLREGIDDVDDPFFLSVLPDDDLFYGGAYFTDDLFEDSILEFVIDIHPYEFEMIDPLFMVGVSELTPELFTFKRSLYLHDEYLLGSTFFSLRPVEVYSNIQNGLGIFAGYTTDTYWFDAEGKPWEEDVIGVGTGEIQPCESLGFLSASRMPSFVERN